MEAMVVPDRLPPVQFLVMEMCIRDSHAPAAYVHSFGCQQNVNDGEKIKCVLQQAGYSLTDRAEGADLVVFNTCAVREHAQQRVYGNIGALKPLKAANPKMLIAIGGCMVQQREVVDKLKQSYPYVCLLYTSRCV